MAPDKIYMPNELLNEEWQRHIEGEDTAYIRKDALLDWLNQRKKLMEEEIGFGLSIDDVIDKLNSM